MRTSLAVGVAILVALAGCSATSPQPAANPTTKTTTNQPPSTSTTTDSTATTTTATTPTSTAVPRFAYENLSDESRNDFERLRAAGHIESPDPLFGPRIADQHYNTFHITYNGSTYEIRHQRQSEESQTCLLGLGAVSNDTVDDDQVEAYQNLSSDGQRLFDRVANGTDSDTCYDPSSYPLRGLSYVRVDGTYYSLVEQHGSTYVYVYSLENVSEDT